MPPTQKLAQAKSLCLSDCIKGSTHVPPKIVIYGRPAIGKTITAAQADAPFFMLSPGETGLHTLMDSGQLRNDIPNIEVGTWADYMGLLEELQTKPHKAQTLIVDTVSGMEPLANNHVRQQDFRGDSGPKDFQAYMAGYRAVAMGAWKESLAALDRIRVLRKMLIVLLAHTGTQKVANPSGGDYSKWAPAFAGHWAWDITYGWADAVLFADYDLAVSKDREKDPKGKASSSGTRWLYADWSPDYDAKNRFAMPAAIEMGTKPQEAWQKISQYITNNTTKEQE